jgi:hypothetical protein
VSVGGFEGKLGVSTIVIPNQASGHERNIAANIAIILKCSGALLEGREIRAYAQTFFTRIRMPCQLRVKRRHNAHTARRDHYGFAALSKFGDLTECLRMGSIGAGSLWRSTGV